MLSSLAKNSGGKHFDMGWLVVVVESGKLRSFRSVSAPRCGWFVGVVAGCWMLDAGYWNGQYIDGSSEET